jgi:UDP-3-O-[3-hydroxymyristoyl] N-acetylglucosamine deacetylase
MLQATIKETIEFSGIGLHTGKIISLKLIPSNSGGIVFVRSDIKDTTQNKIHAIYDNVKNTTLATVLSNEYGHSISTVEHLFSALAIMGVDNLIIDVNNNELPVLDGSAIEFIKKIKDVGLNFLDKKKLFLKILKPISIKNEKYEISIKPFDTFKINLTLDFNTPLIKQQSYAFDVFKDSYRNCLASARTFCFLAEVEYLKSKGLALGGSLDNAVVIAEQGVLNKEGLRYNDEFVRHKILDAIGDLYLSGFLIKGEVFGYKSGHEANNLLLRKIFSDASNYIIEEYSSDVSNSVIFSVNKDLGVV